MRKILLALALSVAMPAGCRGWPEANRDVREVRVLHRVYRAHVSPTSATETARVEELGEKIDSILGHMDELTR